MNLIETYRAVLQAARLVCSEDGYVSSEISGQKKPFTISGKRLVLPTNEQLRNPDKESRVIFHPLRENPLHHGESDVLSAYRSALNTRINASVALLFANLTRLASSVAEHKKLNPDQAEYLSLVKQADDKTFDNLAKIISAMPLGQSVKAFVSIYLKKAGSVNGVKFKKAAIVSFPFYEELLKNSVDVYGVRIRQKDRDVFKNLFQYIFSGITEPGDYSAGSNSNVAPSLEAIMGALKNVGADINAQAENFASVIDDSDVITINSEWVDSFINIERLLPEINRILPQFGNDATLEAPQAPLQATTISNPVVSAPKIPVDEKMDFKGLGHPAVAAPFTQNQSSSRHLSLSDAFGGNFQVSNRVGFNQSPQGYPQPYQQPQVFQPVGFGGQGPFGYNTGSGI